MAEAPGIAVLLELHAEPFLGMTHEQFFHAIKEAVRAEAESMAARRGVRIVMLPEPTINVNEGIERATGKRHFLVSSIWHYEGTPT